MLKSRFRPPVQVAFPDNYHKIFNKYKEYSMIADDPRIFYENMSIVQHFASCIDGAIVECGTWRGGMACAMMELGGIDRNYHFFDSFEGLPDAQEIDGSAAVEYQKNVNSPMYRENCTASYEEFIELIYGQEVPEDNIHVYKGWFEDTLADYNGGPISVLRLDGDWYDSTMTCLKFLYPKVVTGGLIIIDDYDAWEGCARAVHDYLAETKSSSRVDRTPLAHVAFIQKLD